MRKWVLFIVMFLYIPVEARDESTGLAFLRLLKTARSAATMGVFSQVSSTPLAIFENPVGVLDTQPKVALSYNNWFADVTGSALGFSLPAFKGTLAAGFDFVKIPGIEIRDIPSDEALGKVEAQYLATGIGYARPLLTRLSIGGTLKILYEYLYTESAYGVAVDLSGRWQAPSAMDITVSLSNCGRMDPLKAVSTPLPTILKVGFIRPEIFADSPVNLSLGLNLATNVKTEQTYIQVGAEAILSPNLTFRAGYERLGTLDRTALGVGIRVQRFALDYALHFMPEGLGFPQQFSFSFYPGK